MSGALTVAAVLGLAATCQSVVSPQTILKIASHEFGLYPDRIHMNSDGSFDAGIMQINSKNWSWLGLQSMADALDPCKSIAAGAALLASYSRYNSGSPTRSLAYAAAVQALPVEPTTKPAPVQPAVGEPPVVYIRPAHSGRDLLYSTN